MKDMKEKYIEPLADSANVDKSHTIDEYMDRFGYEYNDGLLWDFEESDFESGSIEFRDDIVYWLIDGRYYETDIPFSIKESAKCGTDSEVTEGAEGKRRTGFEWVIYDASEEMEKQQRAPIVAIRKTYVEAQSFINKNREKYGELYADEVPEGKFKKGDDFWGPFDDDWNLIEGAKNCEGGCCDESKKRERETFPAGDPAKNIAAFNHMMGSDQGSQGSPLGEGSDTNDNKKKDLIDKHYQMILDGAEDDIKDLRKQGYTDADIRELAKQYAEEEMEYNKSHKLSEADEVPEGKFKKGDDFWGPFDDDWNLIEGAKNCEGGCCDESKKRERETFPAGDPAKNIAAFNHMMGSDQGSQGSPLGEGSDTNDNKKKDLIDKHYQMILDGAEDDIKDLRKQGYTDADIRELAKQYAEEEMEYNKSHKLSEADEGESIWSGDYDKAHETWDRIKSYLNEKKVEFQIWEIAPNREETLAIEGETAFTLYKASEGEYRIGLGAEASTPESEDFEGEVDSVLRNVIPEDTAKEETEEAKAEAESPLDESLKEGIIDPKDRVSIHNAALKIAKELNKPMLYGYLKASGKEYSIKPVPYNGDEQGTCARYSAQTLMVAYPNKDYIEESLNLKWISQSDDVNRQFIDIINFLDFGLKENEDGTFGLNDYQGANLGGIEDEKFESAQDILNRLSETYFNDYFLNPGEDPEDADSENVKNLNAIHTFIENESANVDLSKAYEIQKEKDGGK